MLRPASSPPAQETTAQKIGFTVDNYPVQLDEPNVAQPVQICPIEPSPPVSGAVYDPTTIRPEVGCQESIWHGDRPSDKQRQSLPKSSGYIFEVEVSTRSEHHWAPSRYRRHRNERHIIVPLSFLPGPVRLPRTVPRTRRTIEPNRARLEEQEKIGLITDTINPSPSTSSRASTVFCTPWDTAPLGEYISDLIKLTGEPNGKTSRKDTCAFRRRTVSSLEQTPVGLRIPGNGELHAVDRREKTTEFQRLLWLWMVNSQAVTDERSKPVGGPQKPHHMNETDVHPPPVPERRVRLHPFKPTVVNSSEVKQSVPLHDVQISPYAVSSCSLGVQPNSNGSGSVTKRQPDALHEDELFGVYDEAFDGTEEEKADNRLLRQPSFRDQEQLVESTTSGPTNSDTTNPENYVYAKVVPRHLRRKVALSKSSSVTVADRVGKFRDKPLMVMKPVFSERCNSSDESTGRLLGNSNNSAVIAEQHLDTAGPVSSSDSGKSKRQQSSPVVSILTISEASSSRSPSPISHEENFLSTPFSPMLNPESGHMDEDCNTQTNSKQTGLYIRRFLHRPASLAPLPAPRNSLPASISLESPVPRTRRTIEPNRARLEEQEKIGLITDTINPSPSTSSRASTVFCTPWDTAPLGEYISDLIKLTGEPNGKTSRKDTCAFRRRTVSSLEQTPVGLRIPGNGELHAVDRREKTTEFQRLLWLWMVNSQAVTDERSKPVGGPQKPHHMNETDVHPPPVPERRVRLHPFKPTVVNSSEVKQSVPLHDVQISIINLLICPCCALLAFDPMYPCCGLLFNFSLMRDKTSRVAEQVSLFLECTRNGTDRGPYRTMQSIQQFIGGMTNYLLRNSEFGLSEAVELEKKQLSDCGFLNVSSLLEKTLQRYILRPLHRHIIRQLKREQIKNNELDPLRTMVQATFTSSTDDNGGTLFDSAEFGLPMGEIVLCDSSGTNTIVFYSCCLLSPVSLKSPQRIPSDSVIQRVGFLFRQMESTYSVTRKLFYLCQMFTEIRNDVNSSCSDRSCSTEQQSRIRRYAMSFVCPQLLASMFCTNVCVLSFSC
ncbi:hypothetical protein AHF37_03397 [Paragonimus kellicotti]|nr:hypothetical protein AHF37_03397 [Paragonimus kellicotti]